MTMLVNRFRIPEMPAVAYPLRALTQEHIIRQHYSSRGVRSSTVLGHLLFRKNPTAKVCHVGPQECAFVFAEEFGLPYVCQVVVQSHSEQRIYNRYCYTAFESIAAIQAYIVNTINPVVFEVIRKNNPCRLYYDIDYVMEGVHSVESDVIDDLISVTMDHVRSLNLSLGASAAQADFVLVKERSVKKTKGFKISFHIISPYMIFQSNWCGKMKALAAQLNNAISPHLSSILGLDEEMRSLTLLLSM